MATPFIKHRPVATFSIVACDLTAGDFGIAVASKFLAAGAVVPWASTGAGAVATQSFADASFGPRGLALMRNGLSAAEALTRLLANDPDREKRQVGLVDARGGAAAHTGTGCYPWAGHIVGDGFACQGNILTGEETVAAMAASFQASSGLLADRLTLALKAGETAGGDRRGRQAAALYVARDKGGYLGKNDVLVDLRVDDATEPVTELQRLLILQDLYFGSSPLAEKLILEGALLGELKSMMRRTGHYRGEMASAWDSETEAALDAFVSTENVEERFDLNARTVDPPAIAYLREKFGGA